MATDPPDSDPEPTPSTDASVWPDPDPADTAAEPDAALAAEPAPADAKVWPDPDPDPADAAAEPDGTAAPAAQALGGPEPAVETQLGGVLARALPDAELSRALKIMVLLAASIIVVAGMRAFASSLGPIFLALVLVVLVHPLQRAVVRRGLPPWLGMIALVLGAYGILVIVAGSLAWSTTRLVDHLGSGIYDQEVTDLQTEAVDLLADFGVGSDDLQDAINSLEISSIAGQVYSAVSGLLGFLSLLSLLVLTMLFMAADTSRFVGQVDSSVRAQRPEVVRAFQSFARSTRSYFFVSTVFGLIVAVFDVIALFILGIPLALVWGVLSVITNYIPNVGFILGLIPPALLAFLEGGWQLMVVVIVVYAAINTIIQTVIQPRFVGDAVGLSATLTFLSLVFWGWVFGPLGALLAVPMTLFVKAIMVDVDPDVRWMQPLIALDRPGKQPTTEVT